MATMIHGLPRTALEAATDAVAHFLEEVPLRSLRERLEDWSCPPALGRFVIDGAALRGDSHAVVALHDSADRSPDPWPFRARVARVWDRWVIVDIVAQCASCFGTGRLGADDELECDTCDGSGWGLRRDAQAE